jgi:threonine dehydrogenase-like Zn-dependent dehydrogenase
MKAGRFYALGDMRLDDVPYPGHPKPGWVTLKVRVVQPSITGAVRARGGPTMDGDFIKKMIEEHAPIQLLGHEFTAEVVELGEGVMSLKAGDREAARSKIPCYQCALCKAGLEDVVRLMAAGQVKVKPTITHVLFGLEKVPESFEITANKGKYDAVNPAQVVVSQ